MSRAPGATTIKEPEDVIGREPYCSILNILNYHPQHHQEFQRHQEFHSARPFHKCFLQGTGGWPLWAIQRILMGMGNKRDFKLRRWVCEILSPSGRQDLEAANDILQEIAKGVKPHPTITVQRLWHFLEKLRKVGHVQNEQRGLYHLTGKWVLLPRVRRLTDTVMACPPDEYIPIGSCSGGATSAVLLGAGTGWPVMDTRLHRRILLLKELVCGLIEKPRKNKGGLLIIPLEDDILFENPTPQTRYIIRKKRVVKQKAPTATATAPKK